MDFRKLAEKYKDDYLKDLNALVSINSIKDDAHAAKNAPFGPAIARALDTFLDMARKDGFEVKNDDGYAGVVEYQTGDPEESLGILGHLDIVPAGDGWTKNPFAVTLEDGYLFGRGVLDDKGPLLAAYYALKMVRDQNIPLKRKVMMIAGTDEESGMAGVEHYLKNGGEVPTLGFTPDAEFPVINGEKGNIHVSLSSKDASIIQSMEAGTRPNVVIGVADAVVDSKDPKKDLFDFYLATNDLKGSAELKEDGVHYHMEGVPAHGSTPYLGINAGTHLLNFIGEAYDDRLSRDLYTLLKDWKGTPENISCEGVYLGFLTMNPGLISRKDGQSNVLIDIRYPNDTNPEKVIRGFEEACKNLSSNITPVLESAGKPLFVAPDSELVTELMKSYQKVTGDTFTPPVQIGGGTYAKEFENFVAFGPERVGEEKTTDAFVGGCHQRDEGIKLDDMLDAMAIYADAIVNLAGE